MKKVTLIRHTDAAIAEGKSQDVNRQLVNTGIVRTRKVIRNLVNNHVTFDCIFSSHATRAIETAKLIANGINYPEDKIVMINRLYNNDIAAYSELIYSMDDNINNIAIVGHNPTITEFANNFLAKKIFPMMPSAMVCIEFSTDSWTEIDMASAKLCYHIYPEML